MTSLAESLIARIIKQRDLLQAMNEHLNSISVRITSKDQSVSVAVDGLGAMTGLWLSDAAYRHGADGLSRLIVETAQAAAAVAMERQSFLVREFNQRMADLQKSSLVRWDGNTFVPPDQRVC